MTDKPVVSPTKSEQSNLTQMSSAHESERHDCSNDTQPEEPTLNPDMSRETSNTDISGNTMEPEIVYLKGLNFWLITLVNAVMLFLVSLDTTITTTSVVPIAEDLGNFAMASWVLSSYQLGWVAVVVISAKLSDIYGRKSIFLASITLFMCFSGGCAAAQTMTQLIIMRTLKGLGGGGCFALTTIIIVESVPPKELGSYATKMNVALIMSLVLGPILGGTLSEKATWRWIFLINLPICAVALVLAFIGIPPGFPYRNRTDSILPEESSKQKLRRVDLIGCVLILASVLSFTAASQEAGSRFPWKSAYVITLLTASGLLWPVTLLWERHVTLHSKIQEPVLPWRFFTNRVRAAVMIGFVSVGMPMVATNFLLPQRFQLINGLSNIDAGLRILPFGVAFCVGSFVSSVVSSKLRVPSIYHILVGSLLQIIGYVLLSRLDASIKMEASIYGHEILCGFGVGISYTTLYLLIPFTADDRDKAIGLGLSAQFRTMGSVFALAIVTSVFNAYTTQRLEKIGMPADITQIEGFATGQNVPFSTGAMDKAREILSEGYNRQMLVLCAFSSVQIPVALMIWQRKQIVTA